jgi:NADPH-dependent 7-cyano-7-deazaguanine reductase QueF
MTSFSPCMVAAPHGVSMSVVSVPIKHLCPFKRELDRGTVDITWRTLTATYELHSLRESLKAFDRVVISHEDLTTFIAEELAQFPEMIDQVTVSTRWDTAGMEVECFTSPILADLQ